MPENVTEQHRTLKAVVIVLGVLIVVSLGIIATTVADRMGKQAHDEPIPLPAEPQPGHPIFFGDVPVTIPEGNRVLQMSVSDGRLLLLLEDSADNRRIYVVDAQSGDYLGTYHLKPEG